MKPDNYIQAIKQIKNEILKARYQVAKLANREMLLLYFKVGKMISEKVAVEKWGDKTIQKLSGDLQNEVSGLRGFSYSNLKNMRLFYETWKDIFQISQTLSGQLEQSENTISPTVSDQLKIQTVLHQKGATTKFSPILPEKFYEYFLSVGFSSHIEIIANAKTIEERVFYITKSAQEFWSNRTLKHHLKNNLFEQQAKLPNNFDKTLEKSVSQNALNAFKDQYLLDFISLSDEEAENERLLENEIVLNIKKFLTSLGSDFAFIGNQFRLIVEDEEYFIDLLFFHRKLQALVAFELKTGKFKPEYLGKMNFYLSAADEYVKQPHENPSIGIIPCKEKKNKIVEFAFRDFSKAMGVATYKTANELPKQYKNLLPDAETLKKLMD